MVRVGAAVGMVAAASSVLASPQARAASSAATDWRLSQDFAVAVGPSNATFEAAPGCNLGPSVQHVVYVGFDNFHMRRDNSNTVANNGDDNRNTDTAIPSDLEQVPALYNFLRGTANAGSTNNTTYSDSTAFSGGTILGNHHTPLISHTSVDFTSAYSAVYGDRNGVATSQNSLAAYNGNLYSTSPAVAAVSGGGSGFGFWTDPLNVPAGNTTPQFLTKNASNAVVNAPAPWVPFTRAGCDVGAISATTMVLENQNSVNDVNAVTTGAPFTTADEGVAVHCASSGTANTPGGICALAGNQGGTDANVKAAPDNLPAEPGAPYGASSGYYALYGHRFVAPAVNDRLNSTTSGGTTTLSLLRAPSSTGFPGFNGEDGNYTLGYVLDMQKAGIPVTFGYLTTPHNCYTSLDGQNTTGWSAAYDDYNAGGTVPASNQCNHTDTTSTTDSGTNSSFGSGEQGYVNYLAQLNTDFQKFFDQAKAAGMTTNNTIFVFYSDENDHMAEGTPSNAPCDGVTTACAYNHAAKQLTPTAGQMGEVTVKLDNTFPQGGNPSYFSLSDSAPEFYVQVQGQSIPSQADPNVRNYERSLGSYTYTDPYTGNPANLTRYIGDQAGLNALHMITADPNRSPTFVDFAPGEDFVEYAGSFNGSDCAATTNTSCSNAGFVGVHGDFAPETTTTWAGIVAPGVTNGFAGGVDAADWTDHVDLRPTVLALAGLSDDYQDEGRVITQILNPGVVNATLSTNGPQLASMLKQLDAPNNGATEGFDSNTPADIAASGFGPAVLKSDTEALESNAGGDSTYTDVTTRINTITNQRNAVVTDIQAQLANAQAGGAWNTAQANTDLANGQCLLTYARQLITYAASPSPGNAPTDCNIVVAALPEVGHTALLIVSAGAIVAGGLLVTGRRRRRNLAA
ncbi:MAG TPA: hypothetical protein VFA83_04275 [Acidimicrobiales bacterium]|nr:hypothetical protein [Acidimicrobiales bacterium]